MRRANSRTTADRVSMHAARVTIEKVDDDPMMQEIGVKVLHDEETQTLEHVHPYGFTAVPKKPDGKKKAEGIAIFLNGSRSHGVVVVVGDRRYRLKKGKPGEVAIHDDQGQKVHLTRDGIIVDGGSNKLPIPLQTGDGSVKIEKDKITHKVKDLVIVHTEDKIRLGSEDASAAVETTEGPSSKIFAVT